MKKYLPTAINGTVALLELYKLTFLVALLALLIGGSMVLILIPDTALINLTHEQSSLLVKYLALFGSAVILLLTLIAITFINPILDFFGLKTKKRTEIASTHRKDGTVHRVMIDNNEGHCVNIYFDTEEHITELSQYQYDNKGEFRKVLEFGDSILFSGKTAYIKKHSHGTKT